MIVERKSLEVSKVLVKMSYLQHFLVVLTTLFLVFYIFLKYSYSYWKRRGFKTFSKANLLFGHFNGTFAQKESMGQFFWRVYKNTNEPFIGVYGVLRPILFIRDPELIRTILIKDFAYFSDRGVHCNQDYDPLSAHLFTLRGSKWKNLRSKLSPTFSSGKLKSMFSTFVACGSTLESYLDDLRKKGELLDVREISARHSTNVIALVAFGIDVDTISNPNHEFRENGRKIFASTFSNAIRFFLKFIAPKVMSIFRIRAIDSGVEHFIKTIVKENLEYREKNNVTRKDFFQLLVQLRNTGTVQLDGHWNTVIKADEEQKKMSLNEIAAQAFVFFAAGFETSSTTLSYCLYELAKNPEIQQRVHDEIDQILKQHSGQLTYESICDMVYLDKCIDGKFVVSLIT